MLDVGCDKKRVSIMGKEVGKWMKLKIVLFFLL